VNIRLPGRVSGSGDRRSEGTEPRRRVGAWRDSRSHARGEDEEAAGFAEKSTIFTSDRSRGDDKTKGIALVSTFVGAPFRESPVRANLPDGLVSLRWWSGDPPAGRRA